MATAIIIFLITYALIVTERVERTTAAVIGAVAMIVFGVIPQDEALRAIDLNVIFLLVGMMLVVNVLSETGVFEWVAVWVARATRGNAIFILLGVVTATGFLSAFLDNVTTVVLIAPVTILITQILNVPSTPFLVLEAIYSNLGGTATLIGDPPNIIIGSRVGLSFNDFLWNLTPVVFIVCISLLLYLFVRYRYSLQAADIDRQKVMEARPERAIVEPAALRRALPVFGLTIAGFMAGHLLHLEPGLVALVGGFLILLVVGVHPREAFCKVEWETIFFLIGLFILVGGLEHQGFFELLGAKMAHATAGNFSLAVQVTLWGSAVLSALLGAMPVVIAFVPLLQSVHENFLQLPHMDAFALQGLWCALSLGACFGSNGTMISTPANVIVAQIAKRNRCPISFVEFSRYSIPITIFSLVISALYLHLRYTS